MSVVAQPTVRERWTVFLERCRSNHLVREGWTVFQEHCRSTYNVRECWTPIHELHCSTHTVRPTCAIDNGCDFLHKCWCSSHIVHKRCCSEHDASNSYSFVLEQCSEHAFHTYRALIRECCFSAHTVRTIFVLER